MDRPELTAFVDECSAVEQTLSAVPPDAWRGPGLGSWTLAELVTHLARGAARLTAYADLPVDPHAVVLDRVSYYRYDAAAEAPGIAARAVQDAAEVDPLALPEQFAQGWRSNAELARMLAAERLITTRFGPMPVVEYLATRVLEVTIHHLDVRVALDLPPTPAPSAGRLTMELLEGLLGGPRPRNLGRVRFLLAATGRIPSDDPRLPVLS